MSFSQKFNSLSYTTSCSAPIIQLLFSLFLLSLLDLRCDLSQPLQDGYQPADVSDLHRSTDAILAAYLSSDEHEHELIDLPLHSTNLVIILGMMQVSKKIPFDDPSVLMGVRILYIVSNVLILGIYLYLQQQINKKKGTTTSLLFSAFLLFLSQVKLT